MYVFGVMLALASALGVLWVVVPWWNRQFDIYTDLDAEIPSSIWGEYFDLRNKCGPLVATLAMNRRFEKIGQLESVGYPESEG